MIYLPLTTPRDKNGLISTVDGNGAGDEKKGRRNMKGKITAFALAAIAAAFVGTASAGVSCRVEPDYSVRLADKPGEAYVKVTLAADKVAAANRPSVNLAIVLDRSGSMHGDKIVKAREAACEAIRRLDSKDIVSVVAYDNTSEVVVPAQYVSEKEALIARIRTIEPRGSTALFDGVTAGANELRKFRGKCEISRVLLLSDGQANVGPSSPEELGRYGALLMKEGIAVSTVGLGVDYNEDLMTRLSQKSDGNSYFVEKSDDLPRVFASELGDVLSVAATKVALKVKFGVGFTPVALIGRDGRILGDTVSIDLNQLYGGQEKYVIVKCDAAPGSVGSAREIAKAEVSYVDPKDDGRKTVTGVGTVTYSADPAAVAASVNKSVVRERALNENAMRTEEALRLADRGEFKAAEVLMQRNYSNSMEVQGVIGRDAALEADANMQLGNSRRMNRGEFSGSVRKGMKTKSFQQMNQQQSIPYEWK